MAVKQGLDQWARFLLALIEDDKDPLWLLDAGGHAVILGLDGGQELVVLVYVHRDVEEVRTLLRHLLQRLRPRGLKPPRVWVVMLGEAAQDLTRKDVFDEELAAAEKAGALAAILWRVRADDEVEPVGPPRPALPKPLRRAIARAKAMDRVPKADLERRLGEAFRRQARQEAELKRFRHGLSERPPRGTWALAGLMGLVFLLEVLWGGSEEASTLFRMGANVPALSLGPEPWRLLSSAFLHAGLLHIGFNMSVLLGLGPLLEGVLGTLNFLTLFTGAAVSGSLASSLLGRGSMSVGASGALWGMLAAAALMGYRSRGRLPEVLARRIRRSTATVLVINLAVSLLPHIDFWAHIGGGLGGLLVVLPLLRGQAREGPPRTHPIEGLLGGLAAVGIVVSLVLALAQGRPWAESAVDTFVKTAVPEAELALDVPGPVADQLHLDRTEGILRLRFGEPSTAPLVVLVEVEDVDPPIGEQRRQALIETLIALSAKASERPPGRVIDGPGGPVVLQRYPTGDEGSYIRLVSVQRRRILAVSVVSPSMDEASAVRTAQRVLLSIRPLDEPPTRRQTPALPLTPPAPSR